MRRESDHLAEASIEHLMCAASAHGAPRASSAQRLAGNGADSQAGGDLVLPLRTQLSPVKLSVKNFGDIETVLLT